MPENKNVNILFIWNWQRHETANKLKFDLGRRGYFPVLEKTMEKNLERTGLPSDHHLLSEDQAFLQSVSGYHSYGSYTEKRDPVKSDTEST